MESMSLAILLPVGRRSATKQWEHSVLHTLTDMTVEVLPSQLSVTALLHLGSLSSFADPALTRCAVAP